jgi:hypothetical protein
MVGIYKMAAADSRPSYSVVDRLVTTLTGRLSLDAQTTGIGKTVTTFEGSPLSEIRHWFWSCS